MTTTPTTEDLINHIEEIYSQLSLLKAQIKIMEKEKEPEDELKVITVRVIWSNGIVETRPWNNLRGLQRTIDGYIERPLVFICNTDPNKIRDPALRDKLLSQFQQYNVYIPT